ncbi:hypothetical protein MTP03_33860 [Tsukamurella sp. PLM1]|nr:hypothetical protein MTP03_33860 [Tsukamurella sp. PLM1]
MTDRAPSAWTGRDDGPGPEHLRWYSAMASGPVAGATALIGFASDAGVVRNLGRPGAAAGPAALRGALGTLALAGDLDVTDLGDVVVTGDGDLETGQERLGAAVTSVLDDGGLPVVLGEATRWPTAATWASRTPAWSPTVRASVC